jgi:hypothetical protein
MTSQMCFMTNGWYLPHRILNDYYSKWLVHNDFRAISHFLSYMSKISIINSNIYLKIFTNVD